ncbi:hypothetical protein OSTOST_18669, partial [Ostertagia ostertagi]
MTDAGDTFFVPFFCAENSTTTAQCAAGTQSKYHVQFTSSDGLTEMRSFVCTKSSNDYAPTAVVKRTARGLRVQPSAQAILQRRDFKAFLPGPSGKLRDCSDRGHLFYDGSKRTYICECDPGFTGESCETGICTQSNASTEGIDVQYRTYTVVIGVDSINYGVESVLLSDASNIASLKAKPSTVWRYQLIVYCDNKIALPVYIGGNYDEFNKAMKSDLRNLYCIRSEQQQGPFNLADVFQVAVGGLGRLVRGLIIFYTENQTYMKVDLEEFISVTRSYRQELYLVAMDAQRHDSLAYDDYTDLRAAAFVTGGNILFVDGNEQMVAPRLS